MWLDPQKGVLMRPTVKNYKTAYKEALIAYTQKRRQATPEDYYRAMAANESVAEKEQEYLVSIDFSDFWNLGITYDELSDPKTADQYRQWVKDWGLTDPTGKKPKEIFTPTA